MPSAPRASLVTSSTYQVRQRATAALPARTKTNMDSGHAMIATAVSFSPALALVRATRVLLAHTRTAAVRTVVPHATTTAQQVCSIPAVA